MKKTKLKKQLQTEVAKEVDNLQKPKNMLKNQPQKEDQPQLRKAKLRQAKLNQLQRKAPQKNQRVEAKVKARVDQEVNLQIKAKREKQASHMPKAKADREVVQLVRVLRKAKLPKKNLKVIM